jgi:hypothetical protein
MRFSAKQAGRAIPVDKAQAREWAKLIATEIAKEMASWYEPGNTQSLADRFRVSGADKHFFRVGGGSKSLSLENVRGEKVDVPVWVFLHYPRSSTPGIEYIPGGFVRSKSSGKYKIPVQLGIRVDARLSPDRYLGRHAREQITKEVYSVLIHEMTHLRDLMKSSPANQGLSEGEGRREYVNRPHEVRAFMQQVIDEVLEQQEQIAKETEGWGLDTSWDWIESRLAQSFSWNDVKKDLDAKNKKLVLKAVARAVADEHPKLMKKYFVPDEDDDMGRVASKYDHIDFTPPKAVADAAKKGLEYRQKASPSNRGGLTPSEAGKAGIGSGVQRAVNLKNRDKVSPETISKMVAFFARHKKNKAVAPEHRDEPWNDKGHVAWLLWGGDPGKQWAEKVQKQMTTIVKKASFPPASKWKSTDDPIGWVLAKPKVEWVRWFSLTKTGRGRLTYAWQWNLNSPDQWSVFTANKPNVDPRKGKPGKHLNTNQVRNLFFSQSGKAITYALHNLQEKMLGELLSKLVRDSTNKIESAARYFSSYYKRNGEWNHKVTPKFTSNLRDPDNYSATIQYAIEFTPKDPLPGWTGLKWQEAIYFKLSEGQATVSKVWSPARGQDSSTITYSLDDLEKIPDQIEEKITQVFNTYILDMAKAKDMAAAKAKAEAEAKSKAKSQRTKKPKSGEIDPDDVTSFLKSLKTLTGGRNRQVSYEGDGEWEVEPQNRQRLDHYVGEYDDRDPDDDDYDDEGWDSNSWEIEYSEPISEDFYEALSKQFGRGKFEIDVGEKGHVYIFLTKPPSKTASARRVAAAWLLQR